MGAHGEAQVISHFFLNLSIITTHCTFSLQVIEGHFHCPRVQVQSLNIATIFPWLLINGQKRLV